MYKTLKDLDVNGKRVLVRVEYNVKVKDGKIISFNTDNIYNLDEPNKE